MKILILYYSGVGNTKMVSTKMFDIFQSSHEVTIASIEKLSADISISNYDALVMGFPTIHASPAKPIVTFINQFKKVQKPIPTFLFTTCGLYSANTLRIFAKMCEKKNLIPILCKSYRCSATDGSLIAPFMKIWFQHEKNLNRKVKDDASDFIERITKKESIHIPRFKLYSILNYPNKFFGQHFSPNIYTHKEQCISCGKCRIDCPTQSIHMDKENYPTINTKTCIHCYRCIHHCQKKALSLSRKKTPKKTLCD